MSTAGTTATADARPATIETIAAKSAALTVHTLDTVNLGDRSYVLAVDGDAIAVDPQRDIDRVLAIAADHDLTIRFVVETHIHNDYVTGGLELARTTGAEYVVPGDVEVAYDRSPATDGSVFTAGRLAVRAVHTPGHTPHHMSYVAMVDGLDLAVLTGGSLLHGSVGRPDLLGPDWTDTLAHAQWRSVRRLADELADHVDVLPTHGFGSFCSATATTSTSSTIGEQRAVNPGLLLDEDAFIEQMLAGLDAFPAYYAHMGPANSAGPTPIDLSLPRRADATELRRRIDDGEWVVDLRSRTAFARSHLRGTLSFDLAGNAITYLGWLIPWGTPLTLLAETPEAITEFQRELVRIGIDRPAAHAVGRPADWAIDAGKELSTFLRVDFRGLAAALSVDSGRLMLDARRTTEWNEGHVKGARHIPLHELPSRVEEVVAWSRAAEHAGRDARVWVSCGSGFRAAVAASLLERAGVPVVHIDDDWTNAVLAGLPLSTEAHAHGFGDALTV
jgi:glyoxylase-like metal-dependent hydrolase (beta-lactamase superfamily II)/rhodanese-related sulfurtransferase